MGLSLELGASLVGLIVLFSAFVAVIAAGPPDITVVLALLPIAVMTGGAPVMLFRRARAARRQAEAADHALADAIRERNLHQAVLEAIPLPIFYKNLKDQLVGGNDAFRQVFGVDASEFLPIGDLAGTDNPPASDRWQPRTIEAAIELDTDAVRQAAITETPLVTGEGDLVGVVSSVIDITERTELERALAAADERYRTIFNNALTAFVLLDREGRLLQFNEAWAGMLGYAAEEVGVLDLVERMPAGGATTLSAMGPLQPDQVPRWEKRFVRKDGNLCWGEVSIVCPIRDSSGRVHTFLAIIQDITQRKALEDQLRQACVDAENATQAKSSFLATMSHEIRTPMNGIIGMLELLQHTELTPDQMEMVGTVLDSATALVAIINDILDFSKIEAGKMVLERVPTELATLIEGIADTLAATARHRNLRLLVFVDPQLPTTVLADPLRLRQILTNLVGNAVKFTEQGKVVLSASLAGYAEEGPIVAFAVADTGIGIAPEVRDRLFKPFSQADDSTTRRFGGTGLGLSISRRLAQLMKADLQLESEVGRGSVFTFTVTLGKVEQKPAPAIQLKGTICRICVADPQEGEFLSRYLTDAGAVLSEAADAEIAIIDAEKMSLPTPYGRRSFILLVDRLEDGSVRPGVADSLVLLRPIHRQALVKAVAVAAGLMAAEIERPSLPVENQRAPQPDIRILVAEDHPVNRRVILHQLKQLGFTADAAENGIEALALWRGGGHSLLLTDCNMPEMDGFGLTAAIRAAEKETGRHLPIIAVTANALRGEADRCLASGMDDYLTKPVTLAALGRMLDKVIASTGTDPSPDHGEAAVSVPQPSQSTVLNALPAIDIDVIDRQIGDAPDIRRALLNEFLQSSSSALEEVAAAIHNRDQTRGMHHAHRLKGSSATAGARSLAEIGRDLETILKIGGWEQAEYLLVTARREFARIGEVVATL
jgi:PAS domain S-box-containing protein